MAAAGRQPRGSDRRHAAHARHRATGSASRCCGRPSIPATRARTSGPGSGCSLTTSSATTATGDLALAAYYQGQTAVDRHGIYAVSRPYIASIKALAAALRRLTARSPGVDPRDPPQAPAAGPGDRLGGHQVDPQLPASRGRSRERGPRASVRYGRRVPRSTVSTAAPARALRRARTSTATSVPSGSTATRSTSPPPGTALAAGADRPPAAGQPACDGVLRRQAEVVPRIAHSVVLAGGESVQADLRLVDDLEAKLRDEVEATAGCRRAAGGSARRIDGATRTAPPRRARRRGSACRSPCSARSRSPG